MRVAALFLIFLAAAFCQEAKEGTAGDAKKLVTVRKIVVEGSRFPDASVIRLSQIKIGDQVNFVKLFEALQKVTKTGLIHNIDFDYDSLPDAETDVVLHMKCTDNAPTAKGWCMTAWKSAAQGWPDQY